jgi:hypothetical protein
MPHYELPTLLAPNWVWKQFSTMSLFLKTATISASRAFSCPLYKIESDNYLIAISLPDTLSCSYRISALNYLSLWSTPSNLASISILSSFYLKLSLFKLSISFYFLLIFCWMLSTSNLTYSISFSFLTIISYKLFSLASVNNTFSLQSK